MSSVIRRLVAVAATSAVLALVGPGVVVSAEAATPQTSTRWRACDKKLDGIKTRLAKTQRTVTIVNQTSKTHARVSFWVRTDSTCSFTRKFLTKTARLGYGGTVDGTKRKQGTGTTPLGTYTMTEAFGNGSAPGMWLPYHRVKKGDYWVGDNASPYYNSLRNKSQGGFRYGLSSSSINGSEYLPSYTKQYRYAVVINFNRAPDTKKTYRGTGIFLHVKGSGATGGCVGITKNQMKKVMAYMKPGDKITIAK
ncbi:MAG: L,D-transpeptidase family protein [Propionibacteriaceae bacterium]